MDILIVTPYYSPDLGPSAPMFSMLAERLVLSGYKVTVLAAAPHFPSGQVAQGYRKKLWTWETLNGVRVGRAWVPSGSRANLAHRLMVFLIFQVLVTFVGVKQKYDVLLITNPAIETALPFTLLGVVRHKPIIFGVWDIYPEVGVRMGLFHSRAVIRLVELMEDFCLRRADRIQVLGDGFIADLVHHKISPSKIVIIPPWVDTDLIKPMPRQNSFSQEHRLDDKFVVLYAGNLGLSQGLETVLEAAQKLSDRPDILFLMVGDGSGKEQLVRKAAELNNVGFLSFQPRRQLPNVLASADVSLVIMKKGIGSGSLPSKTFSILASSRPVLASVDKGSDTWNLIQASQAGLCIPPEDPGELVRAILWFRDDSIRGSQMGRNGRTWIEKYHSPQAATNLFGNMFQEIIGNSKL